MERFTHRYHDGQAWVSLNLVSKMMENECVGLPITKLAEYEDLEESGRLVKLPCAVGDTIWVIGVMGIDKAESYKVTCITYRRDKQENNGVYVYASGRGQISFFADEEWGRTVFLTRESAEAKLKEVQDEM